MESHTYTNSLINIKKKGGKCVMKLPNLSNKGQVTGGLLGLLIVLMVVIIVVTFFWTTSKDILENNSMYTGNWKTALDLVPIVVLISAVGVLAAVGMGIARSGGAR